MTAAKKILWPSSKHAIMVAFLPFLTGCGCVPVSDHLWLGPAPPALSSPSDLIEHLDQQPNTPVREFARVSGFFITPFKRAGILGWRDMGFSATATGTIAQKPVPSTDGFLTIDMRISTLEIDRRIITPPDTRYIRVEACAPAINLHKKDFPTVGETISVQGRVLWGGDGFFEIHPMCPGAIRREGNRAGKN